MANILTAGNSTNGGTAISTDTSGTLNIVTGSGSGATAVTVDGSGNMVVTGTISASGGVSGGIRSGTAVASTSGTSIDFTSLPTGIKRITVIFSGVSTNGTTGFSVQLGDAGGIETTGYAVGTSNSATSTQEFPLTGGSSAAAGIYHGQCVISLIGTNIWSVMAVVARSDTSVAFSMGGSKTLSDTLTQVRIKTGNGTDTFDAGSINILFE
jgi:hypothetical protein